MGEATKRRRAVQGDQQAKILKALERSGAVVRSCAEAGISAQTAWAWRQNDAAFAERWAIALGRYETRVLKAQAARNFRPRKLDEATRRLFLDVLAGTGSVPQAAKAVGVSRTSLYALRRREPGFAKAWQDAFAHGYWMVEEDVVDEVIHGKRPREQGEREAASESLVRAVYAADKKRAAMLRATEDEEAERDRHEALAAKWIADLRTAIAQSRVARGAAA